MKHKEFIQHSFTQETVLKFEELLKNNGILVKKGSDLEEKIFSIFDILYKYKDESQRDYSEDFRQLFRAGAGIYDLAIKILRIENHFDFPQLIPHLKILNECNIAQNEPNKVTDQDANKIIELYIASLCMRFGERVSIDNPKHSKGDNPDIIAELFGKKWGFACKTFHSKSPQTIYDNLSKAVDQIEKSESEIGIPVFNIKNIINHEETWPRNKVFQSVKEPNQIIQNTIKEVEKLLKYVIGINKLTKIFHKKIRFGDFFLLRAKKVYTREGRNQCIIHQLTPPATYKLHHSPGPGTSWCGEISRP